MFSKVMSQSKTDPNEFINKQLEMLKGLNNKELNSMKETLSQKINRIAALEEKIIDLQDLLSKKDQDLLHKSKEQELTIRELELNVKILEEDQERIKSENTILAEELRRSDAEILDHTHLKQSMSVTRGMENNEDLFYLQDKMNATIHQNNEAKNAIFRLKSKVKKLKSTLHKAESIHAHNITLLQTQFDKEHNKWEKERVNYQQEIHTVKRKVIDLTHVLQKYQHKEVLFNTSCIS